MRTTQTTKSIFVILVVLALCVNLLPASAAGLEVIDSDVIITPVDQPFTPREAMQYAMAPDHLYPFIYDGTPPSTWREIDTTDCMVGRLYVYDENTQAVTPIGDQIVTTFASTQDHLFYVTEDQHTFVNSRCSKCGQTEISGGIIESIPGVEEVVVS